MIAVTSTTKEELMSAEQFRVCQERLSQRNVNNAVKRINQKPTVNGIVHPSAMDLFIQNVTVQSSIITES
tara:strand:- start:64 stop:273 length:210 start_codon:yes stop_codon:yes gene_type:complete